MRQYYSAIAAATQLECSSMREIGLTLAHRWVEQLAGISNLVAWKMG